jgi:hypothetical protein
LNNLVNINDKEVLIKEFDNQRVVTFKDIDLVHDRSDGTAKARFNSNKKRFVENEDYYVVSKNSLKYVKHTLGLDNIPNRGLTILTETGYMMLVKTFDDDLAWKVQRQLINGYFKLREEHTLIQPDYSPIIIEINSLKNEIQSVKYIVNRQQPVKLYSKWRKNTTPKIKMLADYFNENQFTILSNLYIELEDSYNIDLNEFKADYCFTMNVDNCSQFDVIENNKQLRDLFDLLIDSLLEKYRLCDESIHTAKRKTIFDTISND